MGTVISRRTLSRVVIILGLIIFAVPVYAAKICYDCHKKAQSEFQSKKTQHDPVKKGMCESCHKRHGFANALILIDNSAELCYTCHKDLKAQFATGKQHFPVEKGACWDCHDPHASNKQALIRDIAGESNDPDGCLSCHKDDLQTVGTAKVKHPPYEKLACLTCHNAHNSEHAGLLKSEPSELCATCHKLDDKKLATAHEGKFITGLKCSDCHSGHSSDRAGLISSKAHSPFADGSCDVCHALPDPNGKITFAEGVTAGNVCANCHAEQAEGPNQPYPHPAVEADNCDNCHAPHSSSNAKLLKEDEGKICRDCHTDLAADTTLPAHMPVALNECTSCHEVHGSKVEHLLKKTGRELCLGCHTGYKAEMDSATTVHAGADDCLQCHDPHQGKQPKLLKATPKELCQNCHEPDRQATLAKSSHSPYLDGDCASCHSPHYTNTPHLTREAGPKLCLACHTQIELRTNMANVHPPAKEDCRTCHAPHVSDQPKLLLSSEKELCTGCHDPSDLGADKGVVHTPVMQGDCTGCHEPHGASQPKLLSGRAKPVTVGGVTILRSPNIGEKRADLCYTCHETLEDKFKTGKIHAPVALGNCDACHTSHGSDNKAFVKDPPAKLCGSCHTPDQALSAKHSGYDMTTADCTDCHNPHSSTKDHLLRANDHPPFAEKSCDNCHTVGPDGKPQLAGEMSEICAACHDLVGTEMAKPVHHAPFEGGQCTDCHSVHSSDYSHMLRSEGNDLCLNCHTDLKDLQKAPVQHKPFVSGKCLDCHAPHASQYEKLTTKPAETFCLSCHTKLKDDMGKGVVHTPAKNGKCLSCHQPHAGPNPSLLVTEKSQLCARCHDLNSPALTTAHHGFDMASVNCQNCHAAHVGQKGSKGLLLPKTHPPFASRDCNQCHQPTGKHELIASGKTLCQTCHTKFTHAMNKAIVHPPVLDDNGCVKCHAPHVGFTKNLLAKDGPATCLTCHSDKEFTGQFKHKPAFEDCANCHEPHSSDYKSLLGTPDIMGLCLTCHKDAPKTHYHPMTKETIDPRTKKPISCVSCHSPHSSDYAGMLLGDKNRKLCVSCHDVSNH